MWDNSEVADKYSSDNRLHLLSAVDINTENIMILQRVMFNVHRSFASFPRQKYFNYNLPSFESGTS